MKQFFTSDLHFGHERVAKIRGFDSIEHHDATIMNNWLKTVTDEDSVWVLGDIALSDPERALDLLGGLPGIKHLIAGNHDPYHPMHRKSHKMQARALGVFDSIQAFAKRKVGSTTVLLSHFPYNDDHTEKVRYAQYRLPDLGEWLLHGHTHKEDQRLHGHEIHVGLDAWGLTPVADHVLADLIKEASKPEPEVEYGVTWGVGSGGDVVSRTLVVSSRAIAERTASNPLQLGKAFVVKRTVGEWVYA